MKKLLIPIIFVLPAFIVTGQTPPAQPYYGPGGYSYPHSSFTFTKFGSDITDCYWIAEPDNPRPDSAVVVVFWHGTTSNPVIDSVPNGQFLFIEHIAQKGYTVIFPLYQYGGVTLPFQQQLTNGANVVNLALQELETGIDRVRPKRKNGKILIGATGISRGGGMTMNVATYHDILNLPSFDALCAFVPGAGQSMLGIDTSTKILIVNGEDNTTNFAASQQAFDSLYHIPCSNKHLIQVNSDLYGTPQLIANHTFAGSGRRINTLDFYGSWKFAVGVFDCAFKNQNCEYCFGADTLITYMGNWSDGMPVNPATIMDTCGTYTGINYYDSPQAFVKIFPNPSNSYIYVDCKNGFTIYNLTGKCIMQSNQPTTQINISDLPTGLYMLRTDNKVGRFIKTE